MCLRNVHAPFISRVIAESTDADKVIIGPISITYPIIGASLIGSHNTLSREDYSTKYSYTTSNGWFMYYLEYHHVGFMGKYTKSVYIPFQGEAEEGYVYWPRVFPINPLWWYSK